MSQTSADADRWKSKARSRVSNGKDILPNVDGRSEIARRYRDIGTAIAVDLGGADRLSETKLQLIRRFSAAAVLSEQAEAAMARGEPFDLQEFCTLASTLVRLAARIGLNRSPRNVNPTLQEYLATVGGEG